MSVKLGMKEIRATHVSVWVACHPYLYHDLDVYTTNTLMLAIERRVDARNIGVDYRLAGMGWVRGAAAEVTVNSCSVVQCL